MKRPLIFWLLFMLAAQLFGRGSLGIQTGVWKPSSLDKEPSKPFTPIPGSGLSGGLQFSTPEWQGFSLQLAGWLWRQSISGQEHKASLLHLSCDVKNLLLTQSWIRPYATYGAALIWGTDDQRALHKDGLTINLGAGIDFMLQKHWGLGIEYQYLYCTMNRRLGLTDDYSGPRLTMMLLYFY
jgi:hypothetical protein